MTTAMATEVNIQLDEESSNPMCRYCLTTLSETSDLILFNPCRCTTPICVTCFMTKHSYGKKIIKRCEICLQKYKQLDTFFPRTNDVERLRHQQPVVPEVVREEHDETTREYLLRTVIPLCCLVETMMLLAFGSLLAFGLASIIVGK